MTEGTLTPVQNVERDVKQIIPLEVEEEHWADPGLWYKPFPDEPPSILPFTGTPGCPLFHPDSSPTYLDFYQCLLDESLWDTLTLNTNIYAERMGE